MQSPLTCEIRDQGVLWCELGNTSKANAINPDLLSALESVDARARSDTSVVAVVLSATHTKHFCAGGDLRFLSTLAPEEATLFADRVRRLCDSISTAPVLWCAFLKGAVLGGGAELALACDMRFAHPSTRLAFSQVRMGLVSGWGGFARLERMVGRSRAISWILEGTELAAEQLSEHGIVKGVYAARTPEETFKEWRARWDSQDARVLRGAMTVIKSRGESAVERTIFEGLWKEKSHREALQNFLGETKA